MIRIPEIATLILSKPANQQRPVYYLIAHLLYFLETLIGLCWFFLVFLQADISNIIT